MPTKATPLFFKMTKIIKPIIKGTSIYFLKLVISLFVLFSLLVLFSSLFQVDLNEKISEALQVRQEFIDEGGVNSALLSTPLLLIIFIVPNLFFWGFEIYSQINGNVGKI